MKTAFKNILLSTLALSNLIAFPALAQPFAASSCPEHIDLIYLGVKGAEYGYREKFIQRITAQGTLNISGDLSWRNEGKFCQYRANAVGVAPVSANSPSDYSINIELNQNGQLVAMVHSNFYAVQGPDSNYFSIESKLATVSPQGIVADANQGEQLLLVPTYRNCYEGACETVVETYATARTLLAK